MEKSEEIKFTFLNLLVFILSIYVLGALLIDTLFTLPEQVSELMFYIDCAICLIFIADFIVRFNQAQNKYQFLRWGWVDLISSIPAIGILRIGRAFRLIRLVRILRAFKSTTHFIRHVYRNRAQGAFTTVSMIAVLLIIFSSIAILQVEKDPNSNIKNAGDAIWWAYVTITTVGYGDKYPVTLEGRLIAMVLMTAGVGLFGTFTAYIASWFAEDKKT